MVDSSSEILYANEVQRSYMNRCSECNAMFVPDNEVNAYSFQNGPEAAYHWAVGAHTKLNDGKQPCKHCGGIYSVRRRS